MPIGTTQKIPFLRQQPHGSQRQGKLMWRFFLLFPILLSCVRRAASAHSQFLQSERRASLCKECFGTIKKTEEEDEKAENKRKVY